jgi:hypothetical protein
MRLIVAFLLSLACCCWAAEDYLDNGVIKIGVDLTKGGSITYLSLSGTTNNLINNHDFGRQIQQSYYSGPDSYNPSNNVHPVWTNWPWNPIQTGDTYGNPSLVLAHTNDGHTLYVKCRPMQWALNNVPGECTFESWISLSGSAATVSNRLLNARTDTVQQFTARDQEQPAVYTIGSLYRLFSYAGNAPFTGGALTNLPVSWEPWCATESWAALLDSNNWGLGVYHPGAVWFLGGFSGTPGTGGPADDPTGYISPRRREVLDSNIAYTYTYQLILGSLTQIRDWVYAQPYRPGCDSVFKSDRQHWSYLGTTDDGWPLTNNRVRVSLNGNDPQMWLFKCAFYATNAPRLYLRAAYHIAHPAGRATGQFFWETNGTGGFVEARSAIFPVLAGGQFHTYEINLAASNEYRDLITQLRLDPAFSGEPGDFVDIQAISSFPFAGNDAVAPILSATLDGDAITVSFPTVSGITAGFIGKNLFYDLESCTNLATGSWQGLSGATNLLGDNSTKAITNSSALASRSFRLKVRLE